MIYTLQYLKQETEKIRGYWNGKDSHFTDGNGDLRTEEDVDAASELMDKIEEIEELIEELNI